MSYTYINKDYNNRQGNEWFSIPLIPVQGWRWLQPIPAAQGTGGTCPSISGTLTYSHTHIDWNNLDPPVYLRCTFLGYGRKLESPKKTNIDMGRVHTLHTENGPGWNQYFSHQRYKKMMLNKMTLFKEMLYTLCYLI